MKKLFIPLVVVATILLISDASAQKIQQFPSYWGNENKAIRSLHRATSTKKFASKTTATDVRLTSVANMEHDGTALRFTDSTTFSYLGSRGGTFDDMWLTWNWDSETGYYYEHNGTTYDPASAKMTTYYNTSGLADSFVVQQWDGTAWLNESKTVYTYDGAGNVATYTEYERNVATGLWSNLSRVSYTYTASGKQATFIQEMWSTSGGTWENFAKNTYTWNTADQLTDILWEFWSGTAWRPSMRTTHTYDGSGNRIESENESWNTTTSVWVPSYKAQSTTFDAYHQPIETTKSLWNTISAAYEQNERVRYSYNTYGKPDYEYSESWNGSSWEVAKYDYRTRYHYEPYTTSGVNEAVNVTANALVYPIPATTTMNIDVSWTDTKQYAATITDATGRVYMSWTSPVMVNKHHEELQIGNLSAGCYILTMQGRTEKVVKQFTVVR